MIIILVVMTMLIDIISKILVSRYLSVGESIRVIDKFLYLTHVRNTGAAWSIFDKAGYVVLIISALIIIGLIMYVIKHKPSNRFEEFGYAFILGGALGNFLNRLCYGYVTDFISVKIFNYDYPIFNVADIFIVLGVIIFAIGTWRCNDGAKSH